MDKAIVFFGLILVLMFLSCQKTSECAKINGNETILPPAPNDNWFADIPTQPQDYVYAYCSCRSNNGQSESVQLLVGNLTGCPRQDLGINNKTCKKLTGYERYNYYSSSINSYHFYYSFSYKEQNQMFLQVSCSLNSLDNRRVDWIYTSNLNNNTYNVSVNYIDEYTGDSIIVDSNKLTLIGPQTIDNIYYSEVYKLDVAFSKKYCKPYSIGTLFFDKRKGAVKYILNNGIEWYIKY